MVARTYHNRIGLAMASVRVRYTRHGESVERDASVQIRLGPEGSGRCTLETEFGLTTRGEEVTATRIKPVR